MTPPAIDPPRKFPRTPPSCPAKSPTASVPGLSGLRAPVARWLPEHPWCLLPEALGACGGEHLRGRAEVARQAMGPRPRPHGPGQGPTPDRVPHRSRRRDSHRSVRCLVASGFWDLGEALQAHGVQPEVVLVLHRKLHHVLGLKLDGLALDGHHGRSDERPPEVAERL